MTSRTLAEIEAAIAQKALPLSRKSSYMAGAVPRQVLLSNGCAFMDKESKRLDAPEEIKLLHLAKASTGRYSKISKTASVSAAHAVLLNLYRCHESCGKRCALMYLSN